jgi:hypothetical protein
VFERTRARRRGKAIRRADPVIAQEDKICAVLGLAKGNGNPLFGSDISLVITDNAVVLVERSVLSLRTHPPRAYPRDQIAVDGWDPQPRWSTLELRTPDGPMDLRVDRVHGDEAAEIAEQLRARD